MRPLGVRGPGPPQWRASPPRCGRPRLWWERSATPPPGPQTMRRLRVPSLPPLDRVRGFAVLRSVESEDLFALGHAQPHEDIDELEDHEGHDRGVRDRGEDSDRLDPELLRVAEGQSVFPGRVHRDGGEDAGGKRAPHAADAVDAEDVEGVVHLEPPGQLDPDVAERAGSETDEDRGRDVHEAGRWRD